MSFTLCGMISEEMTWLSSKTETCEQMSHKCLICSESVVLVRHEAPLQETKNKFQIDTFNS